MSWQGTPMYWKQKAENGNNIAPFILGVMYDKGKGSTPKDNQQAVYWYKKSIAQGDNNAQRNLDLMYKRYPGLKEKYQPYVYSPNNCLFEVKFPIKPTTTQNHSQAYGEVEVAKLTISGSLLKSECFDTHSSAEETITDKVNDVKETLKVLAELHKLNNISIVNNSKKTSHAFLKMEGYKNIADITTMYNIHAHYKNSSLLLLTVKGDKNEFSTNSVIDFLSSVKVKEISEQRSFDNIKKNTSTAGIDKNVLDSMLQSFNSYEKYIQPAKEGDTDAQYYLGRMYHKGKDVIKNDEMAFLWFERAAEQGHAPSQLNLGLMYDKGESTPINYKQAYYWYKKAAEQGNPRAQHNLGSKYIFGLGVEKDYNKAKFWYEKARDNSDKYITKRAIENIEKYKLSEY
jgi:TPR repeat protein